MLRVHRQNLFAVRRAVQARSAELLRLGLLMALTMTLHNFPEGFAVRFPLLLPCLLSVQQLWLQT